MSTEIEQQTKDLKCCQLCNATFRRGEHDPCIKDLPGTYMACCGHGRSFPDEHGNEKLGCGRVWLESGRMIRFPSNIGGHAIREAVDAALAGKELPDGFLEEGYTAWAGLNPGQRQWLFTVALPKLILQAFEITKLVPSPRYLSGEIDNYEEGLTLPETWTLANCLERLKWLTAQQILGKIDEETLSLFIRMEKE